MGALCEHFHWPPDYWRTMGYREFFGWLGVRQRQVRARNEANKVGPNSWAGRENDAFWAEQDAKRRQIRGR